MCGRPPTGVRPRPQNWTYQRQAWTLASSPDGADSANRAGPVPRASGTGATPWSAWYLACHRWLGTDSADRGTSAVRCSSHDPDRLRRGSGVGNVGNVRAESTGGRVRSVRALVPVEHEKSHAHCRGSHERAYECDRRRRVASRVVDGGAAGTGEHGRRTVIHASILRVPARQRLESSWRRHGEPANAELGGRRPTRSAPDLRRSGSVVWAARSGWPGSCTRSHSSLIMSCSSSSQACEQELELDRGELGASVLGPFVGCGESGTTVELARVAARGVPRGGRAGASPASRSRRPRVQSPVPVPPPLRPALRVRRLRPVSRRVLIATRAGSARPTRWRRAGRSRSLTSSSLILLQAHLVGCTPAAPVADHVHGGPERGCRCTSIDEVSRHRSPPGTDSTGSRTAGVGSGTGVGQMLERGPGELDPGVGRIRRRVHRMVAIEDPQPIPGT